MKYKYETFCNVSSLETEGEIEADNDIIAYNMIKDEFLDNCGFDVNIEEI